MGQHNSLPTFFISHGGGPWPWVKGMLPGDWAKLEDSLRRLPLEIGTTPRAILAISGHWEEKHFTVMTSPSPPMYYDYSGFPPATYEIRYRAPGAPDVASRVIELLSNVGIPVRTDSRRGFDHGVFVPLFVAYPQADVPILQLSIQRDYDPKTHFNVGRALAPLRREGIAIIASGASFHNLRALGEAGRVPSRDFEAWLTHALCEVRPEDRFALLSHWESAPSARVSHPQADHFIPLLVAAGAAEQERAERVYFDTTFLGAITSASYRFGPSAS